MHYLGSAMSIEIFRNGTHHKTVTNDTVYRYDSPVQHDMDPVMELLPGDEIKTTCVFNSMSRNESTYFGEGTNDEMCFGFLTVFPKDAFLPGAEKACVQLNDDQTLDLLR